MSLSVISDPPLETPTRAMRRIVLLCGSNEDEAVFMERMMDASAYEVVFADDTEVWKDRMCPKPGPLSAEQVARDYLKGVSEICLASRRTAYVWVRSETSAAAVLIAALLAAELLDTARPSALIS